MEQESTFITSVVRRVIRSSVSFKSCASATARLMSRMAANWAVLWASWACNSVTVGGEMLACCTVSSLLPLPQAEFDG